jgi:hypothetical protein
MGSAGAGVPETSPLESTTPSWNLIGSVSKST